MLFSAGILSLLVASVAAQTSGFDPITAPTEDQVATAGSTLDIVWESTVSEAVTITLLQGATQATLQLGDVIAQSIESSLGTYAWTIPSSVAGYATYGFKLSLDSDPTTFQYSFPFKITSSSSSSVVSSGYASSVASTSVASTSAARTSVALSGTAVVSGVDNQVATTSVSSSAGPASTVQVSSTAATPTVVTINGSSVITPTTSSVSSQVTVASSNSTSNFSMTTSIKGSTGASTIKSSSTSSSASSAKTSAITTSSGAIPAAALKGLSLMGAFALSVALVTL